MIVNFDTASMTPSEARSLITLLSALYPGQAQSSPNPTPAAAPTTAQSGPILVAALETAQQAPEPAADLTPEPATRKRRTKAEIAADEAAAKQAAATQQTEQSAGLAPLPEQTVSTDKPLTAEELRALLNGYIQKHSMEDAIKILQSYECNRVTEALSLPADKLMSLAEALRG